MNNGKTFHAYKPFSFPEIVIMGFLFIGLLLYANLAIAQGTSHNGKQWRSVGGKIVAFGEGDFTNKWSRATRYFHGDGKYWKNDEPTSSKTTGNKIPATHTPEEVTKDIWKRKGQITVRGPGYLGLFMRSKGAGAVLKFAHSGHVFHSQGLGKDEWLHDPQNKWKWYPDEVVDIDPNTQLGGWVPADRTMTLGVWVYNPPSDWGIWGNGYDAPKSVKYEFWYFPREGGKVIEVAKTPGGSIVDNVDGLPPGALGYVSAIIGSGKIVNELTGKTLKKGDILYETDVLKTSDVMVKFILSTYPDAPQIMMKPNTKIQLEKKEKYKKGGITSFFGKLLFSGNGRLHSGFKIIVSNAITSVEGTSFENAYDPDSGRTTVSVYEGMVRLECTKNMVDPVVVNSGMQATMDNNCNHTLSVLDPNKKTSASAGWPDIPDEPGTTKIKQDDTYLNPTTDSHVYAYSYRNWNKSNLGKYENLGAGWHPGGGEKRAYLKFDLSNIDPDSFEKATLKLFHIHTGGSNAVALGVHRVTSPWIEGSDTYHSGQNEKPATGGEITWVNQPSFEQTPELGFNPGKGTNKWIELDITKLVKSWLSGAPNYGLIIKSQGPLQTKPEAQYGFRSREFKQVDKHPVLVLSNTVSDGIGDNTVVDDETEDDQSQTNNSDSITKKQAYAKYIAAYNKLTSLMSKGKGDTPAAQRAYQEFKKAKDLYESLN